MSVCPETVKALITFFPDYNLDRTKIILAAHARGNCAIIRSLDPDFIDNVMKRKLEKKQEILENIEFGVLGIDVLPKSKEFEYCDKISMITAMLPRDRKTFTVSYKELLKLHMDPVHVDGTLKLEIWTLSIVCQSKGSE